MIAIILRVVLVAGLLLAASFSVCANMMLNDAVTQANIAQTICVPGYTKTVRPDVWYTNAIKRQLLSEYHMDKAREVDFELDHRVPLTLGGHPWSTENLLLQSWADKLAGWTGETSAREKDKLEVRLNKLVCAGKLLLAEAQVCIYDSWRNCAARFPAAAKRQQPRKR